MALEETDRRAAELYTAAIRLWYGTDPASDARPMDAVPADKYDVVVENGETTATPTGDPVDPPRPVLWVLAHAMAKKIKELEDKISGS